MSFIRNTSASFLKAQLERPWRILLLALILTVPAAIAARTLGLRTDFSELLPQNKPSVVEMRRVSTHLTSASTLTLVAEVASPDAEALRHFADAVAPQIRALGPEWVGAVDTGSHEFSSFLEKNKLLYAPLDDIRKVHDDVRERYDYEVQKRAGGDLDLGEPPPPLDAASIRARFGNASEKYDQQANGYYIGENGKLLAILIRTPVEPGSVEPAARLRARIDEVVASVNPKRFDPTMQIHYTGDFITSVEEYNAVRSDLGHVGLIGVAMVLGAVLLFFLRIRTLVAMALTIAIGLFWTFGFTRFAIGYLNSSTGFLVSIIAGNGINFGIIYMARYLEARRKEAGSAAEAIRIARRDTWLPTLAAAAAAMVAYGSLAITDFRGFKHFGIIGGAGMILCWAATYAFLPPILVVSERLFPIRTAGGDRAEGGWRGRARGLYGRLFAWLVERFPRAVTVGALITGTAATALTVHYVAADPIEYDMTKLRNERRDKSAAGELSGRVDDVVGRIGQEGMAVMVDRLDQVKPLKAELMRRYAAASEGQKPFEKVVTIFDLLPADQEEKLPLLRDTRDVIERAHARGFISPSDWSDLQSYVPPADLKPLGPSDLPEPMARPFVEKDGTRGRIVYIAPKEGRSVWDAHYLQLWADSFRFVPLPDGSVVRGSGRAVIFADMIDAVVRDAPRAIAASLLGTLVVVLLAFRGRKASLWVMGSLLLGAAWMVAFLSLKDIKLNFLNFVALPITFGIGVDYAVNVMQRWLIEGRPDVKRVVVETGGAVVLCSLTTTLGYLSLTLSTNQAIVTFGLAAAAGEIACILSAVLVLPAALLWRARTSPGAAKPQGGPVDRVALSDRT